MFKIRMDVYFWNFFLATATPIRPMSKEKHGGGFGDSRVQKTAIASFFKGVS
jgi:hypothetical protein